MYISCSKLSSIVHVSPKSRSVLRTGIAFLSTILYFVFLCICLFFESEFVCICAVVSQSLSSRCLFIPGSTALKYVRPVSYRIKDLKQMGFSVMSPSVAADMAKVGREMWGCRRKCTRNVLLIRAQNVEKRKRWGNINAPCLDTQGSVRLLRSLTSCTYCFMRLKYW